MWEESLLGMEKKVASRQASSLSKTNTFDRKTDFSPNKYPSYSKKRENKNGRGVQQDFSNRKPAPQKNRSAIDKRPRSRGGLDDRQREEVVEVAGLEAGSVILHGSKKGNLNHLLNFKFADRSNAAVVGRRSRAHRLTFNKERFLQANCQFVVKDTGNYTLQAKNPDALVDWDLVELVRTFSHENGTCPICLQIPFAGKITRCGHVYCWACILHYLSLDDRSWRKCPICYEAVHKSDLRSVQVIRKQHYTIGDTITFQLMKREKGSTYSVPIVSWENRDGCPQNMDDVKNTEFAKVLTGSAQQIQTAVIEQERAALKAQLASAEPSEVCFIETAFFDLEEREKLLNNKIMVDQTASEVMTQFYEASAPSEHTLGGGISSGVDDAWINDKHETTTGLTGTTQTAPNGFSDIAKAKQYADAFEDVEDKDTMSSLVSETTSEPSEERDSTASLSPSPSLLTPEDEQDVSQSASNTTGQETSLPDMAKFFLPSELAITMTAEEAVEQLELPFEMNIQQCSLNAVKDAFYFYQANDGQHIFLHSLNARCIVNQYGSLQNGPTSITARIVDREVTFMNEDIRKRLRYLSHLPLTCEFQVVEVELGQDIVSEQTLALFAEEIKKRAKRRQRRMRDDRRQAKKNLVEEKKSYGIYPEVRLNIDNIEQFPAPTCHVGHRQRLSSFSDASLTSPTSPKVMGFTVNADESLPNSKTQLTSTDGGSSAFSFAAALKRVRRPPPSPIDTQPRKSEPAMAQNLPPHRVDTDESDNEDLVPVPVFQASFSDAMQKAFDSLSSKPVPMDGKSGGKKKKKEKKVLFSTSMMRR